AHTFAPEEGLRLHLLRPPDAQSQKSDKLGCIVLFHGGSWMVGSPSQFYKHAQTIAKDLGVAVACCQYRLWLTHPRADVPFDAVDDAQRCVRYLHKEADTLGLDKTRLVVGGLSAGGQLAAMTALEAGEEIGLAGLLLLNPVLDLDFTAGWRRRTPLIWLGSTLLRARYGEEALHAKSPLHQVRSLPFPTLILHGEEDDIIPLAQSEAFVSEMQRSHNDCKVIAFPEVNHHFLRAKPEVAERTVIACMRQEFIDAAGLPSVDCISVVAVQESIGSVVKVEGRTVHWFQKGDGFVQTNQPVTVTPLGQLFEVEVIKAVNLGRKLDCELGFCIGLCSKPPRASEKAKTERQDCWIAGGDTSFYLKGVQRRVGKSSADGQQKYLHIGSDLHAKDRVAILAEWSGALSLFVNGEQVGRYSNAIDHSEVVLPLYGVADIFVREASEDYTVRSIGLIGDESEDGWTVQKEQMERAAVELAGIHQLLHGEAAVATTIGPSCDLYACGRILLSLFRGGREVLPSSNLDRFAVAYANWAQAGCPPTEKRYGLLWALKELKGEKTERSEELAQLEKTEVRLVVSRCIKRSRYSRLGSCWEAAEMLASASSWLSMSDDFMKSHLDAVQQAKRSSLLDTHYSLAQELYEQERKLSGESLLNRATHTAMQAAQHRAEGRSVSARWNLRPYIIGPAHIQRILQAVRLNLCAEDIFETKKLAERKRASGAVARWQSFGDGYLQNPVFPDEIFVVDVH
ncbi:aqdA1, partial [Symbiodinium necroappetens]